MRSTTFDATPYLKLVKRVGQAVLELGCGEDRPFLELARRGIDVDGVDSSPDMLTRCHARAAAEGLAVTTFCQRMEDLSLPRVYRAIYLAGPTFTLLPDDDTALRALRRIAAHLHPDGQTMVPLWIPPATPPGNIGRTRDALTADGARARYKVESEDRDPRERTRRTRTRYELVRGTHHEAVHRDWIIHWHGPTGFAKLARTASLEVLSSTPVVDGELTVVLRRS